MHLHSLVFSFLFLSFYFLFLCYPFSFGRSGNLFFSLFLFSILHGGYVFFILKLCVSTVTSLSFPYLTFFYLVPNHLLLPFYYYPFSILLRSYFLCFPAIFSLLFFLFLLSFPSLSLLSFRHYLYYSFIIRLSTPLHS